MTGPSTGCGDEPAGVVDVVDISVVIPVHNCRAYLDRCLTAALVQRVKKEIVVVDDGSTDGSAELLDLYARYHRNVIRVFHQPASGGAGAPRNLGVAKARGRYVFFCDADDYLGPEALERLLAMADRNDSDIVLGKIVGHGRRVPVSMFQQNADRAELGASGVYNSLSCFKLYRRQMLLDHDIRFGEQQLVGEDILFTTHAYCHAETISVVADYDCYNMVSRPDGTSIMQQPGSRDPVDWLQMIRRPIELMTAHVEAGPLRDHLLRRHFRLDAFAQLGTPFLGADDVRRKEIAHEVAELCDRWMTPGVRERLTVTDRRRLDALDDIGQLVRLASVEGAAVHRRLTAVHWEAGHLLITGQAMLLGVEPEGSTAALTLRARHDPACEVIVAAERDGEEFTVRVDVSGLSSGVWDLYMAIECEGVVRLGRLGADREGGITRPTPRLYGDTVVLPYFTRSNGNLSLDVGGHVLSVPGTVRLNRTRWALGQRLVLDGEIIVGTDETPRAGTARRLVWRERHTGVERVDRVVALPGGRFVARPAVGRFVAGTWDAYMEIDLGGPPARFRVEVEAEIIPEPRSWWLSSVRPYATAGKGRLSVVVRKTTPKTIIRRILY